MLIYVAMGTHLQTINYISSFLDAVDNSRSYFGEKHLVRICCHKEHVVMEYYKELPPLLKINTMLDQIASDLAKTFCTKGIF